MRLAAGKDSPAALVGERGESMVPSKLLLCRSERLRANLALNREIGEDASRSLTEPLFNLDGGNPCNRPKG
jgi:hypothetical protein